MSETPNISFTVVERPKAAVTRDAGPNPFAETVADFAKNGSANAAVSFTLEGVKPETTAPRTDKDDKPIRDKDGNELTKPVIDPAVSKAIRQLRAAGAALTPPVTVRSTVTYANPKAKTTTATVKFWTTPKVVKAASTADDAETPAA